MGGMQDEEEGKNKVEHLEEDERNVEEADSCDKQR